ncbi:MAG: hypothetical protein OEZ13_01795 [Spirochaetia bacterium]|nr:hypothetical protein [Spirochaetia bacterium]
MFIELIKEEFKNAPAELDFYRIQNLFFLIKGKNQNIQIIYSDLIYQGKVTKIEPEYIKIYAPGFKLGIERKAILSVEVMNRYYSLEVFIDEVDEYDIFVNFPSEMKYLERRLYKRTSFDDLFARFITLYSPFMQTAHEEKILETRYRHFLQEITSDNPNLNVLFQLLISQIHEITSEFSINLFYEKDKDNLSIQEKKLIETGQSFFISNTAKIESYVEAETSAPDINFSEEFEKMKKEKSKKEALEYFEEIKKKDLENFLVSYAMVPFTLLNKIIGYIRIETNQFEKHMITSLQLSSIKTVADIFSYAITKLRISKSHFNADAIKTQVVNISMNGLLMEIDDQVLYEYLKTHKRIKIMLPILGEELELYGEIVRYFPRDGAYFLGVLIFKSRPGDLQKLENFLFENVHFQFF